MTMKTGLAILAALAALSTAACAPTHSGGTYSRAQAGEEQRVSRGTILAMRDVKVEGTQSGAGVIGGGVIGGVAGSMLGKGSRANLAGAAAGAVLGAVGGSMAESKITEQTSTEFTVREESGAIIAVVGQRGRPARGRPRGRDPRHADPHRARQPAGGPPARVLTGARPRQGIRIPPLTSITWPVTKPLMRSEARKR